MVGYFYVLVSFNAIGFWASTWNRTGLAVFANGLLALRSGWANYQIPVTLLAFMLFLASAAVFLYALCRRRQLLRDQNAMGPPAMPCGWQPPVTSSGDESHRSTQGERPDPRHLAPIH